MAFIWELIKAIPSLISLVKSVMSFIQDLQQKQLDEEQARRQRAIDDLKKAKTIEDIQKANDEITKNLP